ncbi:helix-turn-helix domain-containing protein [Bradyrhizobium sp. SZCCHNS3053]|uniref:helix-turn-helix domain-containing protein n=1 Tax=Bradyrhizobium sp. SZCCHNS3053 TaxID=3057322 RepID=UPI002915C537|nr:helix-turn-helix domain-containing protein [Bradyrhizobium sp. SZCCHNS3053]
MSIEALDWAFKLNRTDVSSTMKLVLLVLADFAGDEDVAFPRQTTISSRSMLTREAVNKNLKKLEGVGLIKATGRTHATGATRSSEYKLNMLASSRHDPRDTDRGVNRDHPQGVNDNHRGENDDHTRSDRGSQGGVNDDHTLNLPLEPSEEPPIKNRVRKTRPWPEDYRQQFWALYPKKPGDSRKEAWAKLDKIEREDEVEFDDIMAGLKHYADRMAAEVRLDRKNVKFIAAAVVWLNQARWETEQPVAPKPTGGAWSAVNGKRVTAI